MAKRKKSHGKIIQHQALRDFLQDEKLSGATKKEMPKMDARD
jgi:hypothetical protein